MDPVDFPQKTVDIAHNQDEYRTLPAFVSDEEAISCWRFSWRERLCVLCGGRLWLRQLNFGRPLQPQLPQIATPFSRVEKHAGRNPAGEGASQESEEKR